MKKERNIGKEILAGIKEIKEWQQGKKKLKSTHLKLPQPVDAADHQNPPTSHIQTHAKIPAV